MIKGFLAFIARGNVIDLAVAVVIGAAFTGVVNSLVKDIITPLIAAVFGKPNFGTLHFTLNHSVFAYGDFLNAVVSFVIVSAVIYYLVVLPMQQVLALRKPAAAAEPAVTACPECLSEIPAAAKRCRYCTATIVPT
jgi:large conductance mechanosensitive channel